MIGDFILIAVICVAVIDLSGFVESIDWGLQKWLGSSLYHLPKPFNCSLCMCFWSCLIYMLIYDCFSLYGVAAALIIALFTPVIEHIITIFRDIADRIVFIIASFFNIK